MRGMKTQTCREPRKRPLTTGLVTLYWKQRTPENLKPVHLIGYAVITSIERKKYSEFAFDDAFAHRDGFKDSSELREWFGDPGTIGGDEYDVITFKFLEERKGYSLGKKLHEWESSQVKKRGAYYGSERGGVMP